MASFAPHGPHRSPGRPARRISGGEKLKTLIAILTHATTSPPVAGRRHPPRQSPPGPPQLAAAAPRPRPAPSARPCMPSSLRSRQPEAQQLLPGRLFECPATCRPSLKSTLISGKPAHGPAYEVGRPPGPSQRSSAPSPRTVATSSTPASSGVRSRHACGVDGLDELRRPRLVAGVPGAGSTGRSDEKRPGASSWPRRPGRAIRASPPHLWLARSASVIDYE